MRGGAPYSTRRGGTSAQARHDGLALGALSSFAAAQQQAMTPPSAQQAMTPPMGWNSYDRFGWNVTEQQFLDNCKILSQKLRPFGYEYCVIDYLWFQSYPDQNVSIDQYGRLLPDPVRWPSSKGNAGFKPVADKVHALGLKFGIHIMKGISYKAVEQNTAVKGTSSKAKEIYNSTSACPWGQYNEKEYQMYGLNMKHAAAQTFYDSLYEQYSQWGVDFIKNDCILGDNMGWSYSPAEIEAQASAITKTGRSIVYSLSPGNNGELQSGRAEVKAGEISKYTNMYRITDDLHDPDTNGDLLIHNLAGGGFSSNAFSLAHIGAPGLHGRSWPDFDMLPFGDQYGLGRSQRAREFASRKKSLSLGKEEEGSHSKLRVHPTKYTYDEQLQMVSLWCFLRSPLMVGGDLRTMGERTIALLTNKEVLAMQSSEWKNVSMFDDSSSIGGQSLWSRWTDDAAFVAMFNLEKAAATQTVQIGDITGLSNFSKCHATDLWATNKTLGEVEKLVLKTKGNSATIIKLSGCT